MVAGDGLLPGGDPAAFDEHAAMSRLTATGSLVGTLGYMSPEHFRGQVHDPRSDQFSFAIALYEALYGERPFPGENFRDLSAAVLAGAIRAAPASDVPSWVHETLLRALARRLDDRFASMNELITTLAEHPARTADPQHDQMVALRQRVWMFTVLAVGGSVLFGLLLYLRFHASADALADFAFWSKILGAVATITVVIANKHVFLRNTYNRWVGTMVASICGGTIACSLAARAAGLATGEADRFVLILVTVTFGQASVNLNRWYVGIAWCGVVGLVASFAAPFLASVTLGVCIILGFGMTGYAWRRRSRAVPRTDSAGGVTSEAERSGVLDVPRQRSPRGPASGPRRDRP